jgi:hypothetical protein
MRIYLFKDILLLPAPKRPIREHNIQTPSVRTVAKQRRWARIWAPKVLRSDDGAIITVKHEVQIWQSPRVPPQELQDAPQSEQVSRLN